MYQHAAVALANCRPDTVPLSRCPCVLAAICSTYQSVNIRKNAAPAAAAASEEVAQVAVAEELLTSYQVKELLKICAHCLVVILAHVCCLGYVSGHVD